jgi:DNA (cytosine-5)-methyltransferase 3A
MKLNVLSLFDGMSCGQQALERCGIEIENYYASEIDKYAIQVTMANYPNTIQLGSVVGVDGYKLPKIDLLIGGSPCQSFSFAGKRKGMATKCETEILTLEHYLELKAEGYEFEGQSYLFWEYMRLLNECKPKYFLLENVEMGEKWEKVLSKAIGVNGIHINSALVSAQNRKRIYWTNIGMQSGGLFGDLESIIQQPKDKGILLKDILESEVDDKYFLSQKMVNGFLAHNKRHIEEKNQTGFNWKPTEGNKKAACLRANAALAATDNSVIVHNTMPRSGNPKQGGTGHLSRNDGKTYYLDTGNTNAVEIVPIKSDLIITSIDIRSDEGLRENKYNKAFALRSQAGGELQGRGVMITNLNENQQKKFNPNINSEKANALTLAQGRAGSSSEYMDAVSKIANITSRIRRLTPIECERLQTVKDNYTNHVSDSQRYKMLGNGWTIDVIAHIFNYLKQDERR